MDTPSRTDEFPISRSHGKNLHLSYFKNSEFYPPFVPTLFDQLFTVLPSLKVRIITLIDDVFSIWKTISSLRRRRDTSTRS